MGNSVILKDAAGSPAGYVIAGGGAIVCRVKLDAPAQIMLLFSDGTSAIHPIDDREEQKLDPLGKRLTGCCVFRGEQIMLLSDEAIRGAACARLPLERTKHCSKPNHCPEQEIKKEEKEQVSSTVPSAKENAFPQRRWPPPPCWDCACYHDGRWQESGE